MPHSPRGDLCPRGYHPQWSIVARPQGRAQAVRPDQLSGRPRRVVFIVCAYGLSERMQAARTRLDVCLMNDIVSPSARADSGVPRLRQPFPSVAVTDGRRCFELPMRERARASRKAPAAVREQDFLNRIVSVWTAESITSSSCGRLVDHVHRPLHAQVHRLNGVERHTVPARSARRFRGVFHVNSPRHHRLERAEACQPASGPWRHCPAAPGPKPWLGIGRADRHL